MRTCNEPNNAMQPLHLSSTSVETSSRLINPQHPTTSLPAPSHLPPPHLSHRQIADGAPFRRVSQRLDIFTLIPENGTDRNAAMCLTKMNQVTKRWR